MAVGMVIWLGGSARSYTPCYSGCDRRLIFVLLLHMISFNRFLCSSLALCWGRLSMAGNCESPISSPDLSELPAFHRRCGSVTRVLSKPKQKWNGRSFSNPIRLLLLPPWATDCKA